MPGMVSLYTLPPVLIDVPVFFFFGGGGIIVGSLSLTLALYLFFSCRIRAPLLRNNIMLYKSMSLV